MADSLHGNSPEFLEAAEQCLGKPYLVSMPATTHCWRSRPATTTKTHRYKGEVRTKRLLKDATKTPITFAQFAADQHACRWVTRTVSEGTKGPITYEFTRCRVTLAKDGLPWKTLWLVIKRTRGDDPRYWYYVSNASRHVRLKLVAWLSGVRWAIEQCFEETKGEVGMDQYEVRKYAGWRRHLLTCFLAHFLCGISRSRWQAVPPASPCLLHTVLPFKHFSTEEMIEIVTWIQANNHRAYLAHRKKKRSVDEHTETQHTSTGGNPSSAGDRP